jgi:predicted acyltransferase
MRLRSLDVFRGLAMAGMVIVNNPGDWSTVYAPLLHAEWHGWTPTDLIFPFFLFVVGASMAQADARRQTVAAVVRRGAALVAIGLFMAGFPFFDVARWRIPGVLQRIGVCYVAAALIWRAIAVAGDRRATAARVLAASAACLLGYWALLALVPPPGGVAGDLSPEGNLGAWLDRAIFGTHLWKTTWDPEGLLSSLPAVGTTLMGLAAGLRLADRSTGRTARVLVAAGVAAAVAGQVWHVVFPINKSLWTSSYAVFTGGIAAVCLGVLHGRLDAPATPPALASWTAPLAALGRNALLLFVLSGLAARVLLVWTVQPDGEPMSMQRWLYVTMFAPLGPPKIASVAYATANLLALYALLAWLHRRRWYWSV